MSSINSTQAGAGLSQFLQSLSPAGSSSASNASNGTTASTISSFLQKLGHHKKGGGGFDKLANAVTNALQSASNGSSGSISTDANQAITQALTKIFENGSLGSTSDTDSDASTTTASTTAASTTPASSNATPSAAATNSTDSGLPADFVKTLKSFGVTAQQFQSDVAAALKTAEQSGVVNVGDAFKSFPIGSVVDSIG